MQLLKLSKNLVILHHCSLKVLFGADLKLNDC